MFGYLDDGANPCRYEHQQAGLLVEQIEKNHNGAETSPEHWGNPEHTDQKMVATRQACNDRTTHCTQSGNKPTSSRSLFFMRVVAYLLCWTFPPCSSSASKSWCRSWMPGNQKGAKKKKSQNIKHDMFIIVSLLNRHNWKHLVVILFLWKCLLRGRQPQRRWEPGSTGWYRRRSL